MGQHRSPKYTSDYSYLLEEQIEVPYQIVGYPEWLERTIPGHLKQIQIPIRVNREAYDLVPVLTELWRTGVLGLDLETGGPKKNDGLDPVSSTSEVLLSQFGNSRRIFVVQPELIRHLKEPLESNEILKINQNIEFDFKWFLKKYGVHIVRMYCTMLSEQVLRAGRDGFGVSLLDLVRYHAFRLISKEVRGQFLNHTGIFTEEQLYYAARDVYLLFDVFPSQNAEIEELALKTVAQDEFNIIPAVAEMELVGVYMDTRYLDLSIDYFARQAVRLKQEVKDAFNEELVRLGKKKQSDDFFADLFGEEDEPEEEFDLDSAEKKLEALRRIGLTLENVQRGTLKKIEHRLTKLLVEYSKVQKIVSTYGERLKKMIHPDDNRLHPQWKQLGRGDADSQGSRENKATIATGRMAGDFQQLPRPQEIFEALSDEAEIQVVRALFKDQIKAAELKLAEELDKEKKAA